MKRACVVVLIACLGMRIALAGEEKPTVAVGQAAPELAFRKVLQAPEGADARLAALRGNVVVLEFWATWCGGCVEAIPHMNELAEKFADKPVRFIAITDEEEPVVRKFLKKRPIRGWIGLQADRSMSRAYGVRMIPRTIVIDREGRLAGMTSPEQLTEQHLSDLLAGKPVEFKPDSAVYLEAYLEQARKQEMDENDRLFTLTIHPTRETKLRAASGFPGEYVAIGAKLRWILGAAYDVRLNRIQGSIPILDQEFDVRCIAQTVPRNRAAKLLQDALCAALCISARRETREVEAYVMTLPGEPGEGLKPSTQPTESTSGPRIKAVGESVDAIAEWLESQLEKPVFDETGLEGRFDYEMMFDKENPQNTFKELEERFGLKVIRAKRPVEFLMVEYAEWENP